MMVCSSPNNSYASINTMLFMTHIQRPAFFGEEEEENIQRDFLRYNE